jgi:hypothetical protein
MIKMYMEVEISSSHGDEYEDCHLLGCYIRVMMEAVAPLKRRSVSTRLHDATFQKMAIFMYMKTVFLWVYYSVRKIKSGKKLQECVSKKEQHNHNNFICIQITKRLKRGSGQLYTTTHGALPNMMHVQEPCIASRQGRYSSQATLIKYDILLPHSFPHNSLLATHTSLSLSHIHTHKKYV